MLTVDVELSVVIPVYNSAQTLQELTVRLEDVLADLVGTNYEIIFVNDGSTDDSWDFLKEKASGTDRIIAFNLTRNFGQHNALMCGLAQASGKYVVTIDDDLQIAPEEIRKLYEKVVSGYDVVYGIYKSKQHSMFRNLGSGFVQFVYRLTFKMNIQITSFRIIRREILVNLLSYKRSFTYIDGLICWYTKNIETVYVKHDERRVGNSGYSLTKLVTLSLNMLTNFSIVPLQAASMFGLLFASIGFLFGAFLIFKKLFFGISVSGYTSLIVTIMVFSGVQLLTVGLLGEYIGRIHINISKQPQYSVREIIKYIGSQPSRNIDVERQTGEC